MDFKLTAWLELIFLACAVGCAGGPLVSAAGDGDLKKVTALLDQGADIQKPDGGMDPCATPLMKAAENGQDAVVKELLKRGANIDSTGNSRTISALWCAADTRQESTVRLLLDSGARVPANFVKDLRNMHALFGIMPKAYTPIIAMLEKAEADQRTRPLAPAPPPPSEAASPPPAVRPDEPPPAEKPWWAQSDSK